MAASKIQSFVQLGDAVAELKQKYPRASNALDQIQEYCNQVSIRLAALEIPVIQDQVQAAAGVSVGYIVVTVGNQQFKVEAYRLQ